jgi:hypothetical protein
MVEQPADLHIAGATLVHRVVDPERVGSVTQFRYGPDELSGS